MDSITAQQVAAAVTRVAEALERFSAALSASLATGEQGEDPPEVSAAMECCSSSEPHAAAAPVAPPRANPAAIRLDEPENAADPGTSTTADGAHRHPCPSTVDVLRRCAARGGIAVRGYQLPADADEPLDRLATEIAEALDRLADLPHVLRRGASTQRPQVLRLRDEPAEVVATTVAMADRLHELGLLSHARQDRGSRTLTVRVTDAGVPFLAGAWLARHAATAAARAFPQDRDAPALLRAVELQLPDGSTTLVDAVTLTLDGRLVCVHAYAGAYQDQLGRCVRLRRALRIDAAQYVVALAAASPSACRELGAIHGLTVTSATDIDSAMSAAVSGPSPRDVIGGRLRHEPNVGPAVATTTAGRSAHRRCRQPMIGRCRSKSSAAHRPPVRPTWRGFGRCFDTPFCTRAAQIAKQSFPRRLQRRTGHRVMSAT